MSARGSHHWTVDGISDGVARIEEDGVRIISVPVHLLPPRVTEGQLLRVSCEPGSTRGSVVVTIALDPVSTRDAKLKSKAELGRAMKSSRKRDKGGDVAL